MHAQDISDHNDRTAHCSTHTAGSPFFVYLCLEFVDASLVLQMPVSEVSNGKKGVLSDHGVAGVDGAVVHHHLHTANGACVYAIQVKIISEKAYYEEAYMRMYDALYMMWGRACDCER